MLCVQDIWTDEQKDKIQAGCDPQLVLDNKRTNFEWKSFMSAVSAQHAPQPRFNFSKQIKLPALRHVQA